MKIYRICNHNLQFKNTFVDSYKGQSNLILYASLNNEIVGRVEYVIYDDEVSVSYIEVDKNHRRQGIGTKLLQELQKIYPNQSFDMGMFTSDGIKLWNSLPKK
jgi:ribosomal protein S18 acetylase RimI-like enzyme